VLLVIVTDFEMHEVYISVVGSHTSGACLCELLHPKKLPGQKSHCLGSNTGPSYALLM
jgi:hypothetical protein